MKYMDIGCKVNCWECTRNCDKKDLMELSIFLSYLPDLYISVIYKDKEFLLNSENVLDFFYFSVIDSLKPIAGMLIAQGKDPKEVHQDLMEMAVSFYVARLKIIETISKH